MTRATDVFGININRNPISYIEREIDEDFKNALTANEHSVIMIYGTSKQGKSSLRRHILPDQFCTFVPASAGMTTEALYREILNQAKVEGPIAIDSEWKISGGGNGRVALPDWLAGLVKLSANIQVDRRSKKTQSEVDVDYSSAASVARKYCAEVGQKPIVIDNFHYFPPDLQHIIATDIRAFEDKGVKTIIMGTWKARDYLTRANPDLSGRVCALSIEPWSRTDFNRVIDTGEQALNVRFDEPTRHALVTKAAGNIGLLQKGLSAVLRKEQIRETCEHTLTIANERTVREVYRDISKELVSEKSNQLKRITEIGEKWLQGRTRTYYIIKAFIEDPQSSNMEGIELPRVIAKTNELIRREVPDAPPLNENAFSMLVKHNLITGQQRLITTPILAYDNLENRLVPLDSWLLFTLRHHRSEILAEF